MRGHLINLDYRWHWVILAKLIILYVRSVSHNKVVILSLISCLQFANFVCWGKQEIGIWTVRIYHLPILWKSGYNSKIVFIINPLITELGHMSSQGLLLHSIKTTFWKLLNFINTHQKNFREINEKGISLQTLVRINLKIIVVLNCNQKVNLIVFSPLSC